MSGGTVTPITSGVPGPAITTYAGPSSCLSLARYAEVLGIDEPGLFGLRYDGQESLACGAVWTQRERNDLLNSLQDAQEEMENELHFPLCPRWFADEQHPYRNRVITQWAKVIEVGVMASSSVATSSAPDYSTEPAVVGPFAVTFTDTSEVHVYHAGTDSEIHPSQVTISGGVLTLYIPRARMVKPSLWNNPTTGLEYVDTTNYAASVDVVRLYNDPTTQGTMVWPGGWTACPSCGESTDTACLYLRSPLVGSLEPRRATYTNGSWVVSVCPTCTNRKAALVRVNYRAGVSVMTTQLERALIRLAHSKLPMGPCGCDLVRGYWEADRHVPDNMSADRESCPFGTSDGAWFAWMQVKRLRVIRSSTL